jgi:hypothetical protein
MTAHRIDGWDASAHVSPTASSKAIGAWRMETLMPRPGARADCLHGFHSPRSRRSPELTSASASVGSNNPIQGLNHWPCLSCDKPNTNAERSPLRKNAGDYSDSHASSLRDARRSNRRGVDLRNFPWCRISRGVVRWGPSPSRSKRFEHVEALPNVGRGIWGDWHGGRRYGLLCIQSDFRPLESAVNNAL